jgi:segregation and condensation protein A
LHRPTVPIQSAVPASHGTVPASHGAVAVTRSAAVEATASRLDPVPYTVSTPVFEGPFDLLLHLISRQQVDLWEVSVSSIVDAYVETLVGMRGALDLEAATEFLLIAAVLVELKAHRLLPEPDDVDLDEELSRWEERDLLLSRLLESKTFKDAAGALTRLLDTAGWSWPRVAGLEERFAGLAPDPLSGLTPEKLRRAAEAVLAPKPVVRVGIDHIHQVRTTVADAVVELVAELPGAGRITFARLTAGLGERLEVIVRFLALLELYKQGVIELDQVGNFAELQICWTGGDGAAPGTADIEEYSG